MNAKLLYFLTFLFCLGILSGCEGCHDPINIQALSVPKEALIDYGELVRVGKIDKHIMTMGLLQVQTEGAARVFSEDMLAVQSEIEKAQKFIGDDSAFSNAHNLLKNLGTFVDEHLPSEIAQADQDMASAIKLVHFLDNKLLPEVFSKGQALISMLADSPKKAGMEGLLVSLNKNIKRLYAKAVLASLYLTETFMRSQLGLLEDHTQNMVSELEKLTSFNDAPVGPMAVAKKNQLKQTLQEILGEIAGIRLLVDQIDDLNQQVEARLQKIVTKLSLSLAHMEDTFLKQTRVLEGESLKEHFRLAQNIMEQMKTQVDLFQKVESKKEEHWVIEAKNDTVGTAVSPILRHSLISNAERLQDALQKEGALVFMENENLEAQADVLALAARFVHGLGTAHGDHAHAVIKIDLGALEDQTKKYKLRPSEREQYYAFILHNIEKMHTVANGDVNAIFVIDEEDWSKEFSLAKIIGFFKKARLIVLSKKPLQKIFPTATPAHLTAFSKRPMSVSEMAAVSRTLLLETNEKRKTQGAPPLQIGLVAETIAKTLGAFAPDFAQVRAIADVVRRVETAVGFRPIGGTELVQTSLRALEQVASSVNMDDVLKSGVLWSSAEEVERSLDKNSRTYEKVAQMGGQAVLENQARLAMELEQNAVRQRFRKHMEVAFSEVFMYVNDYKTQLHNQRNRLQFAKRLQNAREGVLTLRASVTELTAFLERLAKDSLCSGYLMIAGTQGMPRSPRDYFRHTISAMKYAGIDTSVTNTDLGTIFDKMLVAFRANAPLASGLTEKQKVWLIPNCMITGSKIDQKSRLAANAQKTQADFLGSIALTKAEIVNFADLLLKKLENFDSPRTYSQAKQAYVDLFGSNVKLLDTFLEENTPVARAGMFKSLKYVPPEWFKEQTWGLWPAGGTYIDDLGYAERHRVKDGKKDFVESFGSGRRLHQFNARFWALALSKVFGKMDHVVMDNGLVPSPVANPSQLFAGFNANDVAYKKLSEKLQKGDLQKAMNLDLLLDQADSLVDIYGGMLKGLYQHLDPLEYAQFQAGQLSLSPFLKFFDALTKTMKEQAFVDQIESGRMQSAIKGWLSALNPPAVHARWPGSPVVERFEGAPGPALTVEQDMNLRNIWPELVTLASQATIHLNNILYHVNEVKP